MVKVKSDRYILREIERVYLQTFIRRYSLEKFGKVFTVINYTDVSEAHFRLVKDVKDSLLKNKMITDSELFRLLQMFGVSVKAYFDRLDELLMGKLLEMYKFEKAYISDELLGTYLEVRDEKNDRE